MKWGEGGWGKHISKILQKRGALKHSFRNGLDDKGGSIFAGVQAFYR